MGRIHVLIGVISLLAVTPVARAAAPPLYVIPVEWPNGGTVGPSQPLDIDIYTDDVSALAQQLGVPDKARASTHFRYRIERYLPLESKSERTWLEPTFVVDYQEPAVEKAYRAWGKAYRRRYSRPDLVRFVAKYVNGISGRGLDIASRVAERREGDCTEHAVLTAALARRAGLPARVVFGVALLRAPKGLAAMGHAWTEIRENGQWLIVDAALLDATVNVNYIPYAVMDDEGPGFVGSSFRWMRMMIQKIVVVGQGSPVMTQ